MNKRHRPHSHSHAAGVFSALAQMLLSRVGLFAIGGVFVLAFAAGIAADYWFGLPEEATATYVGRQSCVQCHEQQARHWTGSHHDLAMDLATARRCWRISTNRSCRITASRAACSREEGKYFVHTDGPDGKLADFEVKYVFGVTPLQQYMVEFDRPADMPERKSAACKCCANSWDTKRKRWFHQNPARREGKARARRRAALDRHRAAVEHMCAECHSTNLQKNFDLASRTYHTTYSEIDVSCEACHGPGSLHVQLAKQPSLFWDRKRGYALAKLKEESNLPQMEACAPCHSRRRPVHDGYAAGAAATIFTPTELLRDQIYHADGQILEEVYEYGSFPQSKMYHKNVRCSDCHDPHSLALKHEGNKLCTSCHAPSRRQVRQAVPSQSQSRLEGRVVRRVPHAGDDLHGVDPRRDHSLRIPRPDLSVKLGTPNACVACHIADSKIPGGQTTEVAVP